MAARPTDPVEVRPNVLQGQSRPNTFRSDPGYGAAPMQYLNSGGGNMATPNRRSVSLLPIRAVVVLAIILIIAGLYLLNGTP